MRFVCCSFCLGRTCSEFSQSLLNEGKGRWGVCLCFSAAGTPFGLTNGLGQQGLDRQIATIEDTYLAFCLPLLLV